MSEEPMSRLVALAWGVVAAPQRGPKRELSHERIVEAAVALADAEGLQAVTMQRLAQGFGFTTMAMYRYVASKDDLQQLMLDAVIPADGWAIDHEDWRAGLEQWVRTVGAAYERHPWALDIRISMEALLMPGQMRAVDAGLRAMRSLPGSLEGKLAVLMMLSVQVRGFAMMARDIRASGGAVAQATRRLVVEVAAQGGLPDLQPLIASGGFFGDSDGMEPETDDLGIVLDLLLPGIEGALAAMPGEPATPERTPAQELAAAEAELAATIALRKATQRRVGQLEKAEARLRTVRDRAKAAAKEAARRGAG
ncbi:MAG TPA: helix-turn-helix domain-containing protein [Arachnia sp.]|jgi:AcrR family transcriptional regulator|nr:TetR/AcrR family transcriptional regulator [Propionibacteriaceae bacterium]HQD22286.1 helix-turn-helix domain-containing protein [Arachnia sp.]